MLNVPVGPLPVVVLQTLWANFQDICQLMKRQPEHVFSFVVAELGTEGSIDGNQRLVLRGQFCFSVCCVNGGRVVIGAAKSF